MVRKVTTVHSLQTTGVSGPGRAVDRDHIRFHCQVQPAIKPEATADYCSSPAAHCLHMLINLISSTVT